MATAIIMPRQGQSVESCIIAKWHKSKGDQVQAGELLFSYETDKASFDEEAKVGGILLDVFFAEGDDVPCLTNVCVIGNEGESTAEFNPNAQTAVTVAAVEKEQPAQSGPKAEQKPEAAVPVPMTEGERIKISPRAKNLAEKAGVDYRFAVPSGPYGRIVEKDIQSLKENGHMMTAAARDEFLKSDATQLIQGTGLGGRVTTGDLNVKAAPAAEAAVQAEGPLVEEVKLTNIRKVIAKAMHNSLSTTAQLTLNTSFDATEIMEFRKKLKENKDKLGLENITLNDIILYAVSRTLVNHKDLNAHFLDDKMLYFKNVNLGVAVDTERGLMVPNIFNANLKSLNEISREVKKLVKDCQSGTINPDFLKGGSFTITNLGSLDIESFTPVLNAPQTGILGVNNIIQRAREVDGEYEFYPAMGLSLTFDHRALDGAPAAKFLKELKSNLENFSVMLAK
ncbi:MAG: 2-oxo acid dehydrogenase subunit E2 [Clostridia bacterium]|nr:2-oxo acid dehydrogenase subunit E2 [Clostridia bacterium]